MLSNNRSILSKNMQSYLSEFVIVFLISYCALSIITSPNLAQIICISLIATAMVRNNGSEH